MSECRTDLPRFEHKLSAEIAEVFENLANILHEYLDTFKRVPNTIPPSIRQIEIHLQVLYYTILSQEQVKLNIQSIYKRRPVPKQLVTAEFIDQETGLLEYPACEKWLDLHKKLGETSSLIRHLDI